MSSCEYWELVDRIMVENPEEPLLASLTERHTKVAEVYLALALKRLEQKPEVSAPEEVIPDETLRELWRQRTALFGEMNKLSNRFHECKSDGQRADNSRAVLAIWDRILAVKAKIEYYQQHGSLPEEIGEQLPDNPVALGKKVASLRARISQKKAALLSLAALDPGTPGKDDKIAAGEQDLKDLRHLLGLAVNKLQPYGEE